MTSVLSRTLPQQKEMRELCAQALHELNHASSASSLTTASMESSTLSDKAGQSDGVDTFHTNPGALTTAPNPTTTPNTPATPTTATTTSNTRATTTTTGPPTTNGTPPRAGSGSGSSPSATAAAEAAAAAAAAASAEFDWSKFSALTSKTSSASLASAVESLIFRAVRESELFHDFFEQDILKFAKVLAAGAKILSLPARAARNFTMAYDEELFPESFIIVLAGDATSLWRRPKSKHHPIDVHGSDVAAPRVPQRLQLGDCIGLQKIQTLNRERSSRPSKRGRGHEIEGSPSVELTAVGSIAVSFLQIPPSYFTRCLATFKHRSLRRSVLLKTTHLLPKHTAPFGVEHFTNSNAGSTSRLEGASGLAIDDAIRRFMYRWDHFRNKPAIEVEIAAHLCSPHARLIACQPSMELLKHETGPTKSDTPNTAVVCLFLTGLAGAAEDGVEANQSTFGPGSCCAIPTYPDGPTSDQEGGHAVRIRALSGPGEDASSFFLTNQATAASNSSADTDVLRVLALPSSVVASALATARDARVQTAVSTLQRIPAFRGSSISEQYDWWQYFRPETFQRGDILFDQGGESGLVKFIIDGTCTALHRDDHQSPPPGATPAHDGTDGHSIDSGGDLQRGAPSAQKEEVRWNPLFSFHAGDAVGDIAFCLNCPQPFRVLVTSQHATIWTLRDSLAIRERLKVPLEQLREAAVRLEQCLVLAVPEVDPAQVDFFTETFTKRYLRDLIPFQEVVRSNDPVVLAHIAQGFRLSKVRTGDVLAHKGRPCKHFSLLVRGSGVVYPDQEKVRRARAALASAKPTHIDELFAVGVGQDSGAEPRLELQMLRGNSSALTSNALVTHQTAKAALAEEELSLEPGQFFGMMSLISENALNSNKIVARTDCWLATLEPKILHEIVDECTNAPYRRKFAFFRNLSSLHRLSDKAINTLVNCCSESVWSKGDILLEAGARNSSKLFFVVEGECEVYGPLTEDTKRVVDQRRQRARRRGANSSNSVNNSNKNANTAVEPRERAASHDDSDPSPNVRKTLRRATDKIRQIHAQDFGLVTSIEDDGATPGSSPPATSKTQTTTADKTYGDMSPASSLQGTPHWRSDATAIHLSVDALRGALNAPELQLKPGDHVLQAKLQASHFTKKWHKFANIQEGDWFGAAAFFGLHRAQPHRIVASGWTPERVHHMSASAGTSEDGHGGQNSSVGGEGQQVHVFELKLPSKRFNAEKIVNLLWPLRELTSRRLAWRQNQLERFKTLALEMLKESIAESATSGSSVKRPKRPLVPSKGTHTRSPTKARSSIVQTRPRSKPYLSYPTRAAVHATALKSIPVVSPSALPTVQGGGTPRKSSSRAGTVESAPTTLEQKLPLPTPTVHGSVPPAVLGHVQVSGVALSPRHKGGLKKDSSSDPSRSRFLLDDGLKYAGNQHSPRSPRQPSIAVLRRPKGQRFDVLDVGSMGSRATPERSVPDSALSEELELRQFLRLPQVKRSMKQVRWKYRYQW